MKTYEQAILERLATEDKPASTRAENMNLFDAICNTDLTVEEIVDAVAKDTLPTRFYVKDPATGENAND